ncbi:hypothetical protein GCM10007940_25040 [Portibacter lacus]|uniref:Uncharacterized protein n=1 Tax=Portibacter lacus TaxID=1099794 RepID=A0AA37SQS7_9BACT|nr:hypothetical protein GCM10007940_25040 [Portibacter lacus]
MRQTNTCPKCQCTEIYVAKGRKHSQNGNKIMISNFKVIPLDHFTCVQCGYTEEWVTDAKSLEVMRKKISQQKPRQNYSDFV